MVFILSHHGDMFRSGTQGRDRRHYPRLNTREHEGGEDMHAVVSMVATILLRCFRATVAVKHTVQ
jgi:hypothetical protein